MQKHTLKWYVASIFVFALLFFGQMSFTHAALISNEEVEVQKKEVLLAIVNTLEEHIKFLQMALIQKLETRVKELQIIVDRQ